MNEHYVYGFASLGPNKKYPRFGEGFKLDHIPVDFLLVEDVGRHLMRFLDSRDKGWQRFWTSSAALIIDGLLDCHFNPAAKLVNTYRSQARTLLPLDGLVLVSDTTCRIASAAVIEQLVLTARKETMPSALTNWVDRHNSILDNAGGVAVTEIRTCETRHVAEADFPKEHSLKRYLIQERKPIECARDQLS
jgi:hypothetical protein